MLSGVALEVFDANDPTEPYSISRGASVCAMGAGAAAMDEGGGDPFSKFESAAKNQRSQLQRALPDWALPAVLPTGAAGYLDMTKEHPVSKMIVRFKHHAAVRENSVAELVCTTQNRGYCQLNMVPLIKMFKVQAYLTGFLAKQRVAMSKIDSSQNNKIDWNAEAHDASRTLELLIHDSIVSDLKNTSMGDVRQFLWKSHEVLLVHYRFEGDEEAAKQMDAKQMDAQKEDVGF